MIYLTFPLRDVLNQVSAEEKQYCLDWADQTVEGVITHRAHYEMERCYIPVVFTDDIWNNVPSAIENGDPEWLYALNRHSILLNLAHAFAYTEDERYRNAFIKLITSYLDNTDYKEEYLLTSWRSLETGIRPENWIRSIEIFEALGSPLPSSLIDRMDESLHKHAKQLLNTHGAFHRLSNWGMIQEHGLFLLGVYFKDEEYISKAIERFEEEITFQTISDGTHWEQSTVYHCEILHSALDLILLARKHGIALPPAIAEKALLLSQGLSSFLHRDGSIYIMGDSDDIQALDLVYLAAYLFEDEKLISRAAGKKEENFFDLGLEEIQVNQKERESELLSSGRNGFIHKGIFDVHLIASNLGSGHGHISPLHVDIDAFGLPFIVDSGRYTYVDCEIRNQLKDKRAHNTIILNHDEVCHSKGSWGYDRIGECAITGFRKTEICDYLEALNLDYLSQGVALKRKVLVLEHCVVLIDEVLGNEEKSFFYEALFHVHPKAIADKEGRLITLSYGGKNLYISSSSDISLSDSIYSPTYNVLEKNTSLILTNELRAMGSVVTVFSSRKEEPEFLPVSLIGCEYCFPPEEAIAFSIGDTIVISRSHEIPKQVDILKAGYAEGYGRVLVQKKGDKYATTLVW